MRTVDLFCGCGGMSHGFSRAGFDIVAAYDSWDLALEAYQKNFSHSCQRFDLSESQLAAKEIAKHAPEAIIGGPPCQDFSIAGKLVESKRASLTVAFADIVANVRPSVFVMENVYNISRSRALPEALRIFQNAGYGLTSRTIDASLVGVPQMRKRYFLIGSLKLPDDAFGSALDQSLAEQQMTVHDFFGNKLDTEYYYAHPRSYNRRAVFSIHEPSATIRRVNRPIPQNYARHPADKTSIGGHVRPLTTRERAAIQTFPPDFIFPGASSHQEHLIANAVPPNLAYYVAKQVISKLEEFRPAITNLQQSR